MQQLCWHNEINTLRQWRKSLIVWAEIYDFITKNKANLHWAKSQIKLTSSDLRKCKDILTVLVFMEIEKGETECRIYRSNFLVVCGLPQMQEDGPQGKWS